MVIGWICSRDLSRHLGRAYLHEVLATVIAVESRMSTRVLSLPQWRCYRDFEPLVSHTNVQLGCGRSWRSFLERFWLRWFSPLCTYWGRVFQVHQVFIQFFWHVRLSSGRGRRKRGCDAADVAVCAAAESRHGVAAHSVSPTQPALPPPAAQTPTALRQRGWGGLWRGWRRQRSGYWRRRLWQPLYGDGDDGDGDGDDDGGNKGGDGVDDDGDHRMMMTTTKTTVIVLTMAMMITRVGMVLMTMAMIITTMGLLGYNDDDDDNGYWRQ